uniref:Uncharacterized protein n=1 Tax=Pristionchus pacificus TaxID=54126 RepID=A0A2A6CW44_PRIPA|eukprot:PDM82454.1 hypothetical protein PRIPAC_36847 [Pristionchus pacificus]
MHDALLTKRAAKLAKVNLINGCYVSSVRDAREYVTDDNHYFVLELGVLKFRLARSRKDAQFKR